MNANDVIDLLQLEPLPHEGGYFRRSYTAPNTEVDARQPLSTAIYALFTEQDFSAMHRLQGDELYHFYFGDPLEMLLLSPEGDGEIFMLGQDFQAGMRPQKLVPGNYWQGSRVLPKGRYGFSLIGTSMTPGFHWQDFELGNGQSLMEAYPDFQQAIKKRVHQV